MTTLIEAARLALEALERADKISGYPNNKKPITALRQAIEQAQQAEPVAWMHPEWRTYTRAPAVSPTQKDGWKPLYTSPPVASNNTSQHRVDEPAKQRHKPLTDEQVEKIIKANMSLQMNLAGIRADFEAAHGIKGEA